MLPSLINVMLQMALGQKNTTTDTTLLELIRCANDLTSLLLECSLHVGNGLGEWSVMTVTAIFS
jgi:hypothetical protein